MKKQRYINSVGRKAVLNELDDDVCCQNAFVVKESYGLQPDYEKCFLQMFNASLYRKQVSKVTNMSGSEIKHSAQGSGELQAWELMGAAMTHSITFVDAFSLHSYWDQPS